MKITKKQLEKLIKEAVLNNLKEDYMPSKYNSVQDLIEQYKPTIVSYLEDGKIKFAMKIVEAVIHDAYQLGQDEMEAKMFRMHKRGELDDDDDVLDDDKPGFFKKKFGLPDDV